MSYFSDMADFRWNQACIVDLGAGKFPIWRVGGEGNSGTLYMEIIYKWYNLTKKVVFLTVAGFGIFGPHKKLGERAQPRAPRHGPPPPAKTTTLARHRPSRRRPPPTSHTRQLTHTRRKEPHASRHTRLAQ